MVEMTDRYHYRCPMPDKATWNTYRRKLNRRMCDRCREREGTIQSGRERLCPECAKETR